MAVLSDTTDPAKAQRFHDLESRIVYSIGIVDRILNI